MAGKKKGLRIGGWRITPLGIAVIVIIIALIALAVLFFSGKLGGLDGQVTLFNSATATPAPTQAPERTPTPRPTATVKPTATPTPRPQKVTVRALGEISMGTDLLKSVYDRQTSTFDFTPMFSLAGDVIGSADYTIADVEGVMGSRSTVNGTSDKMITPPSLMDALKEAGVDMLMLGNDHALDDGTAGLYAEIANAQAAGLDYIGAAATPEERSKPVVVDINGIKVGFISYCEALNIDEKAVDQNELIYCVNLISMSSAPVDIATVREAGAEVVVALMNWGLPHSTELTEGEKQVSEYLAMAGVDVILGYHPGIVQPVKWITVNNGGETHKTLCMYAPGSLLTDETSDGLNCGYIFQFTLNRENGVVTVEEPQYIPTWCMSFDGDNGLKQYRAVAIGQWGEDALTSGELPEGMRYSDTQYMAQIWTKMQTLMENGANIAEITKE